MVTIAEILDFPELRRGGPRVVAGADQLHRRVEWVHTTELTDIGPLVRGGDLVLTTGIAMPEDARTLAGFAHGLASAGAAGLVVELGRRWSGAPSSLVAACAERGLPLIELHREVRFAAVTQAVCEQLTDTRVSELREHQRIDAIFTELSLSEAAPEEVLAAMQRLTAASVVLESADHEVLLFHEGPGSGDAFLVDWSRRSRSSTPDGRTGWDECNSWLVTRLGRPERPWGRLILESPTRPCSRDFMIAERGAAALIYHRVHQPDKVSPVRRRHREALSGLVSAAHTADVHRRTAALGFPSLGVQYIGIAIAPTCTTTSASNRARLMDDVVKATLRAAELSLAHVLVAAFEGHVKVLVAVEQRVDAEEAIDRLHAGVCERVPVVTGAGSVVGDLSQAGRTLQEAAHVLMGIPRDAAGVHRLPGLGVRGLISLLRGDNRLSTFALRQLAPLSEGADGTRSGDLLRTLEVLLAEWGSKSAAASRLAISRSVLYERIERIERLVGRKLDDPEVRTSLHLALLYQEMMGVRDATASTSA